MPRPQNADSFKTASSSEILDKKIDRKKNRRWKNGTVALRQIRSLQKSTDEIFPRESFKRLVKEVLQDFSLEARIGTGVVDALRSASEAYLIEHMSAGNLVAVNRNSKTLKLKDYRTAKKIINHQF